MKIHPGKLPFTLAAVSAAVLVTASLQAAPSIYDGFDYTLSSGLATQNGGVGFSGAWASPGGAVTATIVSGLTFGANLSTVGNAVQIVNSGANTWGSDSIIARPVTSAPATTYWQSYLFNVTDYGSGFNLQGVGSGSGEFATGVTATNYGSQQAAIRSAGGDGGFGSALSAGTTYLTIAQYTGSSINAWVFTQAGFNNWVSNGSTEGSLSTYAFSNGSRSGDSSFTGTLVLGGYSTGGAITAVFDEIRYGSSLADVTVTAVPEPGAIGLAFGVSLLGLAMHRRRRKA